VTRVAAAKPRSLTRGALRPQDARLSNLRLLTTSLYDNPGLSRADLARLTGLSRVAISDLIAELLESGLIVETGAADQGKPGKRATKLQVAYDWRDIVAIDVSGPRSVTGAIFSLDGEICQRIERPLAGKRGPAALQVVIDTVRALVELALRPVLGIGIGAPGLVGPTPGVITSTNLDWHQVEVGAVVSEVVGLPVEVQNDANLAALAERRFGGAPDDFIRMQISRGVGAGLMIGGQLVNGRNGSAGEIGHVVVDRSGGQCSCGKVGCLETWISLPALTARLADADDPELVLAQAGEKLGQALSFVVAMTDIPHIVLGGSPEFLAGSFEAAAERRLNAAIRIESKAPASLSLSNLGPEAVLLGAAVQVMNRNLGIR